MSLTSSLNSGLNYNVERPSNENRAMVPFNSTTAGGGGYKKEERAIGMVGLSNQGATCYLNSLIQTLFMTPEFRDNIMKWDFNGWARKIFEEKLSQQNVEGKQNSGDNVSMEEKFEQYKEKIEGESIPRQLQKLFVKLLLGGTHYESTEQLTKSFGWDHNESFNQHDVQELCRVLFEALENVWMGTEQKDLINHLYQGEMKDFVQCLNCGSESSRKDHFLDIPLVIRSFGATKSVSCLEEAFDKFVEVETLNGSNQYQCDKCASKQDALKGLKFIKFPYLLTLQLKRFDFDYTTMRRIKLHDHVTFPFILDLNHLISQGGLRLSKKGKIDGDLRDGGWVDDVRGSETKENLPEDDRYKMKIDEAIKNGPYVYELYSILIHRGTAMGGHYYAYVKSFREGKWFCFNDSFVSEVSIETLKEAYGGKGSYVSAYMLMYRQYDPGRNIQESQKDDIPAEIRLSCEEDTKK
eukprot:TRINITY_DN3918_c0_g1_i1.p1 TRINITY_DN3918_c0_g1~~TRINITY_DN3918_c0_g1_i1.p1  ORF type:complete len:466 (+),score=98.05 TRINITY_DN3918_c0_g1_i1:90-1487(+)